jgi:hypothetical protein
MRLSDEVLTNLVEGDRQQVATVVWDWLEDLGIPVEDRRETVEDLFYILLAAGYTIECAALERSEDGGAPHPAPDLPHPDPE